MKSLLWLITIGTLSVSGVQNAIAGDVLLQVSPTEDAPLVGAPPSGLFRGAGETAGVAQAGDSYGVTSVHRIPSGIGASETWVEIAPVDANGQIDESQTGWAKFIEKGDEVGEPSATSGVATSFETLNLKVINEAYGTDFDNANQLFGN